MVIESSDGYADPRIRGKGIPVHTHRMSPVNNVTGSRGFFNVLKPPGQSLSSELVLWHNWLQDNMCWPSGPIPRGAALCRSCDATQDKLWLHQENEDQKGRSRVNAGPGPNYSTFTVWDRRLQRDIVIVWRKIYLWQRTNLRSQRRWHSTQDTGTTDNVNSFEWVHCFRLSRS